MVKESKKNTCGTCGHCDLEFDDSRTVGDKMYPYCKLTKEVIEDEDKECCDEYE